MPKMPKLPPKMRFKHGAYYYDHGPGPDGKRHWARLSTDLKEAKIKWAQIEAEVSDTSRDTFAGLIDYYIANILPTKKPKTQQGYHTSARKLRAVFGC